MKSAKQAVKNILSKLPENTSFEDIQYHIYIREKIERGLKDIQKGRVVDHNEVERRLKKWL